MSGTSFPDGELSVVKRLQKFKQNGRRLYCSYQLDSNFQLFIFSWRDLKNLLTMAAIHFFSVTNWLYTTRRSDEGVQTSHWCLACFFNRLLVNWGRDRLTMLTRPRAVNELGGPVIPGMVTLDCNTKPHFCSSWILWIYWNCYNCVSRSSQGHT